MKLSSRALGVSPSPTLAIDAKVKQMQRDGIDIVGLGAGEPDFDTPLAVKRAAVSAIERGFTKYTATAGIPELRLAVCHRLLREYGLSYTPDQVVVSSGAKHSLYNIFQALCNPGDEVIIFSPYWVSYPEMVKLAGGVPVAVGTHAANGFGPDLTALRAAIGPRTRCILVNSPCNPTGAVFCRADLEAIAELAGAHDLTIVSDEIYDRLTYETEFTSVASLSPEVQERTVLVNGTSKTYAMTGWRIGYAVGDRALMAAVADIQSHSTSNANSIAQQAALTALTDPAVEPEVVAMVEQFRLRRDALVAGLSSIPGLECPEPAGAFYALPKVSALFGLSHGGRRVSSSDDLAEALLTEAGVAVVPGTGFDAPEHLRLSYAASMQTIESAIGRIRDFVSRLS